MCRLFPPAPTIIREAARATNLGGYAIAKGQWLGCAVYSMHRNPKYWQACATATASLSLLPL
jgi:cytochrome P450 family 3 subfamily A